MFPTLGLGFGNGDLFAYPVECRYIFSRKLLLQCPASLFNQLLNLVLRVELLLEFLNLYAVITESGSGCAKVSGLLQPAALLLDKGLDAF